VPSRVAALDENRLPPAIPSRPSPVAQIGPLGKPVGAVVAAAKVLRALHASERPLNASEVARGAGLHRGTAHNILRTLQSEGFVGYCPSSEFLRQRAC
jgi:DNA-binding MarR family transcriptional regulator